MGIIVNIRLSKESSSNPSISKCSSKPILILIQRNTWQLSWQEIAELTTPASSTIWETIYMYLSLQQCFSLHKNKIHFIPQKKKKKGCEVRDQKSII